MKPSPAIIARRLAALQKLREIYAPIKPAIDSAIGHPYSPTETATNIKDTCDQGEEKTESTLSVQPFEEPQVITAPLEVAAQGAMRLDGNADSPNIRDQINAFVAVADEMNHGNGEEIIKQPLDAFLQDVIAFVPRCLHLKKELQGKEKKAYREKLCKEMRKVIPTFKNTPPLLDNQLVAIPELVKAFCNGENALTIAATGSGKAYAAAYMIRFLRKYVQAKLDDDKDVWFITKPTLVEQASRVILEEYRSKRVHVCSYSQLVTSSMANMYIRWETVIKNSQPTQVPVWDDMFKPDAFIIDEVQCCKNEDSQQTRSLLAAIPACRDESGAIIKPRPLMWGMSATPYSRPIHTRFAACMLSPTQRTTYGGHRIGEHNFTEWVSSICKTVRPPCTPQEWSPAAMRKIQAILEPHCVRFDSIIYRKRTIIKQLVIPFGSVEERALYDEAFDEYQKRRVEIDSQPELYGQAAKLVAMMQFRKKAETIRAPHMADKAMDAMIRGKNVIIACAFRDTLDLAKATLLRAGFPEDQIAEIKGGQSQTQRQRNIDEFQSEKRTVMLMMFSAGGAGLSLHQYDKCNKRPREVYLPPVWNAEELVQVLGRAHRINSDSTTYQYIMWYEDTIEEEVAEKVKLKCSALKEVVGKREDWTKFFLGEKDAEELSRIKRDEERSEDAEFDDEEDSHTMCELPVSTEDEDADKEPEETTYDEILAEELTNV